MYFVDLDEFIPFMEESTNGLCKLNLGSPVEVTSVKSSHKNKLLTDNLCSSKVDDKLMIMYQPPSCVYFDEKILGCNNVSCSLDRSNDKVVISKEKRYGASQGLLAFSGVLSGNGLIESIRQVACLPKYEGVVLSTVKLLAVGMRGDDLFGLYYIPSRSGLAIETTPMRGISSVSYKEISLSKYKRFNVEDWFYNTRVREVVESAAIGV